MCNLTGSPKDLNYCSSRAFITPPPNEALSPKPTFFHWHACADVFAEGVDALAVPAVRFTENDPINPHIINLSVYSRYRGIFLMKFAFKLCTGPSRLNLWVAFILLQYRYCLLPFTNSTPPFDPMIDIL